jgi:hypothetical protein
MQVILYSENKMPACDVAGMTVIAVRTGQIPVVTSPDITCTYYLE